MQFYCLSLLFDVVKCAHRNCFNAFLCDFNGNFLISIDFISSAVRAVIKIRVNYSIDMKFPINRLTKQLKLISSKSQCSTISTISLLLYVIFICFVLSITFPLRSTNSNDIVTINRNRFSVDEINQLTDDEQKFIDKANTVGYVENKNYMLQHAFKM